MPRNLNTHSRSESRLRRYGLWRLQLYVRSIGVDLDYVRFTAGQVELGYE